MGVHPSLKHMACVPCFYQDHIRFALSSLWIQRPAGTAVAEMPLPSTDPAALSAVQALLHLLPAAVWLTLMLLPRPSAALPAHEGLPCPIQQTE